MWHNNRDVTMTYATQASAWANISGLGWRKLKPDSDDAVMNIFIMMNAARANNRKVNVYLNADDQIIYAYLK